MKVEAVRIKDLNVGDMVLWTRKFSSDTPCFMKIESLAWGPGSRARKIFVEGDMYSQWFGKKDILLVAK